MSSFTIQGIILTGIKAKLSGLSSSLSMPSLQHGTGGWWRRGFPDYVISLNPFYPHYSWSSSAYSG